MNKDWFLDEYLKKLTKNGSDVEELKVIRKKLEKGLKNIRSNPYDSIRTLVDEIEEETSKFMAMKSEAGIDYVTGISSCIYLPNPKNDGYKIKFIGGVDSRVDGKDIDSDTLFDIASITKLYTLLITFKLVELGVLKLDEKINDIDNSFDLEDFTINDLLLLCGEIYTKGNIKDAKSKEEAEKILKTAYLKSNSRTCNTYTDFGAIIISKVIEKRLFDLSSTYRSFDQIMSDYILKPFNLYHTMYNPTNVITTGNGNKENLVHDPKARILGNVGSAGIFTNSDDLAKLAYEMFVVKYVNYDAFRNLISRENLLKIGTVTFENSPQSNKGLLGMYQKNASKDKWLQPLIYGDNSFTAQGFTGSVAIFDSKNNIHNSILVNAVREESESTENYKNDKPIGYLDAFHAYHRFITQQTIILKMIKEYYDFYYKNNTVDISIEKSK